MKMNDTLSQYTDSNKPDDSEFLSLMLASSIHEVKNNFGKLVFAINDALEELPPEKSSRLHDKVNSEIRYISNQLSQILILYKDHQTGYSPNIEEIPVAQLLRETKARHFVGDSTIQIGTECDGDLIAFIDDKFVTNLLDTFIYNAQSAGATHLLISATQRDTFVEMIIEDDGPGFPASILSKFQSGESMLGESDLQSNSFGLGLFFAQKILALHTNESLEGSCTISNGGRLGGATVMLRFP